MKATKQRINRFRKNLKQFLKLKKSGKLNGSAASIEEKLKVAADSAGLDFAKEVKSLASEASRVGGRETAKVKRENPVTFIENSKGKLNFGEITKEIGKEIKRQAGYIRLTKEGFEHVEKHQKEINSIGYDSIIEFIETVAGSFEAIYTDRGALLLALKNRPSKLAVVRLEKSTKGDFYVIKTALPVRSDFFKKKKLLWEKAQSTRRNEAAPGAVSGHKSFSNKDTKKTDKKRKPGGSGNPPKKENMHQPSPGSKNKDTKKSDKRENPATGKKCVVTVKAKTNAKENGIEIRFSNEPPEYILEKLHKNGFSYYTPKGEPSFWAAKISKKTKEVAESIAGDFDEAVVRLRKKADGKSKTANVKRESSKPLKKTYRDFKKGDKVSFVGLPKEVDGKKNPLIGKSGVVVNSQPHDVDVRIKGYGTTGFLPENLVKSGKGISIDEISEDWITYGNETVIDFKADGSIKEDAHYALVEITEVEASHNKDCSVNSDHIISRSQPRDRSKEDLCAQPAFIAKNLNPASITQGNLAFVGAPITYLYTGNGTVGLYTIQGNGRTIALKIAYDEYPESADKYKNYLIEHADKYGFTPEQVKGYNQPILIRVAQVSKQRAVKLGNVVDTSQAKMSKIDQAKAYIRNLSDEQLLIIGKFIRNSEGETIGAIIDDVGIDMIGQLKELDRTGIVARGQLTQEGKTFLRSVLVGLVFDAQEAPNVLHHYMNLPHRIKAGLERSFGYIIPLIGSPGDIREVLYGAVEIAAQVSKNDDISTAKEYASTDDMFEKKSFSKGEIAMAQFFLDASTQKEIRDAFSYYDELIRGKKTLFGEEKPKPKKEAVQLVFVEKARPNPAHEAKQKVHDVIVRAQRLQTLGNNNSKEIKKLDYLLGPDGWKWNSQKTQIIQINEDIKPLQTPKRDNPAELTPKIKRAVLDDFWQWVQGNPLMDYTPGPITFANWIRYHYPGYEDVQSEIWAIARPARQNSDRYTEIDNMMSSHTDIRKNIDEQDRFANLSILQQFRFASVGSNDFTRFQKWLKKHHPDRAEQARQIWQTRPYGDQRDNPDARFISLGICKKISIDQGKSESVELTGPLAMLTNKAMNKLFIVPFSEMKEIDDNVADLSAEKAFEEWHNYRADDKNYSVNWPSGKKARPVGTAADIYYYSDKIMRKSDQKGEMNLYHHEFDAGKRPCKVKGNILIVSNIKIDERGILN